MNPAAPQPLRTVLYVYEGAYLTCRRRLEGVFKAARRISVRVALLDVCVNRDIRAMLDLVRPDGVIAESDAVTDAALRLFARRHLPAVICGDVSHLHAAPRYRVVHDSRETARVALRELLSFGYPSYGFVGYWADCEWSVQRETVFREMMSEAGRRGAVLRPSAACRRDDAKTFYSAVTDFLRSLPKPCGVLAVNDEMAMNVLSAALVAGFAVPEDVAIVGIDDDEILCDNASVTLSSVAPDFGKGGELALDLLVRALGDPDLPSTCLPFGPRPFVRRASSSVFKVRLDGVLEALEAIRRGCTDTAFDVDDVASAMGCSRRSAEVRFRRSTGESIGAAIRRHRLERAELLLLEEGASVADVAARSGFANAHSFQSAFRRMHGLSPRDWAAEKRQ